MATEMGGGPARFRPVAVAVGLLVVGHLIALVVFPVTPGLGVVFAIQAAGLLVLVVAERLAGMPTWEIIALALCYMGIVAGTWYLQSITDSLVVTGLVVLTVVTLASHGLDRVGRHRLGLLEDADEQ